VPPASFLPALRAACGEAGALLVADEGWTGLGRSGAWLPRGHHGGVAPVGCPRTGGGGGGPPPAGAGRGELEHLLRSVDPAVDAQITRLHEDIGRRVHDVERVVSRAEEQLPPPVREAVHTIRTHLGELLAP